MDGTLKAATMLVGDAECVATVELGRTPGPSTLSRIVVSRSIGDAGKLLLVDQNLQSCIVNPGYASCRTTLDPQ